MSHTRTPLAPADPGQAGAIRFRRTCSAPGLPEFLGGPLPNDQFSSDLPAAAAP